MAMVPVALPLFVVAVLFYRRVLPRIRQALNALDALDSGDETFDEPREEAAVVGPPAPEEPEEDAVALAATRAEGHRVRDAILAEGRARRAAHCAAAETQLRISVSELASNLAADGPHRNRRTP
ncbi:hypothetical protein MUK60_08495 [Streptomyces sp. LRE541]|uniref:hypothetical protein n=1 Tax=Streptomyces sp. LRE541 TaxID=2931983 RepID=UPI00200EB670|nr:hypothetical protein [Streptomyces sp. LRE541]UPZ27848.1 hypothetical protein MUK60_08495 [Streptomyces sp. LRE541]